MPAPLWACRAGPGLSQQTTGSAPQLSSGRGPHPSPGPRQPPLQVNGLTIRLMFNKDKNWTRALKHMLVDLKVEARLGGGGGGVAVGEGRSATVWGG